MTKSISSIFEDLSSNYFNNNSMTQSYKIAGFLRRALQEFINVNNYVDKFYFSCEIGICLVFLLLIFPNLLIEILIFYPLGLCINALNRLLYIVCKPFGINVPVMSVKTSVFTVILSMAAIGVVAFLVGFVAGLITCAALFVAVFPIVAISKFILEKFISIKSSIAYISSKVATCITLLLLAIVGIGFGVLGILVATIVTAAVIALAVFSLGVAVEKLAMVLCLPFKCCFSAKNTVPKDGNSLASRSDLQEEQSNHKTIIGLMQSMVKGQLYVYGLMAPPPVNPEFYETLVPKNDGSEDDGSSVVFTPRDSSAAVMQ